MNYMISEAPLIQSNVNLAPFNTLHVKARAHHFAVVRSEQELSALLNDKSRVDEEMFVLGGGSNVLFLKDYGGLILHIAIGGKKVIKQDDDHIWLSIGAGENWHEIVRYCVQKGWGGIENLSLIPGTAGAAPIQNIGAYGVELSDVFVKLIAVEKQNGAIHHITKEECRFGYRDSIFKQEWKNKFAVTRIILKLSKKPKINTEYGVIRKKMAEKDIAHPTIKNISDIVMEIRNSKLPDPTKLANAGSFFKNPIINDAAFQKIKQRFPSIPGYALDSQGVKVPAGWLIEKTGWKGKKVGKAGTYRQQALVIVNHGGASGEQIWHLAQKIQQSVREKFSLELVPEVNIV